MCFIFCIHGIGVLLSSALWNEPKDISQTRRAELFPLSGLLLYFSEFSRCGRCDSCLAVLGEASLCPPCSACCCLHPAIWPDGTEKFGRDLWEQCIAEYIFFLLIVVVDLFAILFQFRRNVIGRTLGDWPCHCQYTFCTLLRSPRWANGRIRRAAAPWTPWAPSCSARR